MRPVREKSSTGWEPALSGPFFEKAGGRKSFSLFLIFLSDISIDKNREDAYGEAVFEMKE